ncbi:AMP-binding protein [uncultured Microbacterium sp.]|uniref:AMP-binding protein n=1 Tax=uncultured Microbacterium sp. TaxID=191216 RepID=UPI0026046E62|nr:AMP-binding protein [uncultured Microbacterium sp.]
MNELAHRILAVRAGRSDARAISDPKDALTNRELIAAAHVTAADIRRSALRESPLVAVSLPLSNRSVVHLLAAILGDYSICFLDPTTPMGRRGGILAALQPDIVVGADDAREASVRHLDSLQVAAAGYVAMSSGSTGGGPKGVLSTWTAIAAFVAAGADALELDHEGRWAEVSNPAYDMAITNLLIALASGAEIHVSSALGDQLRPLRFIDRVAATHVRLAPRFIELGVAERRAHAGTALRVWGSGGDRLPIGHVNQVFGFGVPAVVNTYGTSETIGFASTARFAASDDVPSERGTVPIGRGSVGLWATDTVDIDGIRMLTIASPHLPRGYFFGETDDYPRWQSDGSVLTGDVGERVNGSLYCWGRAGRRVKRSGSFVDLDEIDEALRDGRTIPTFTVMTLAGQLVSLVEGPGGEISGLRRDAASVLRPEVLPDLVAVPRLPRLANGKVDQGAASALAEALFASQPVPSPDMSPQRGEW